MKTNRHISYKEKLNLVKSEIGSKDNFDYLLTSEFLTNKMKLTIIWAYDELQKERPNSIVIDEAFIIISRIRIKHEKLVQEAIDRVKKSIKNIQDNSIDKDYQDMEEGKCNMCKGKGEVTCQTCNGIGKVAPFAPVGPGVIFCPICYGSGYVACPECNGTGYKD